MSAISTGPQLPLAVYKRLVCKITAILINSTEWLDAFSRVSLSPYTEPVNIHWNIVCKIHLTPLGLGNIAILSPVCNITMCNINITAVFELSIILYVQYIAVCCNISQYDRIQMALLVYTGDNYSVW